LTWIHIKSYIQALFRKIFGLSDYREEQVIWRRWILETHPIGSNCLKTGHCPCECTTEDVILSNEACDQKCFPAMMDRDTWELFKQSNRIYIDMINKKVVRYI